ncbi:MAG: hypothetical protein GXP54_04190, partial [Deltaproteobacteria bacterium]|nr:hypothetical protein [Deltaproteobacteria bacterium]
ALGRLQLRLMDGRNQRRRANATIIMKGLLGAGVTGPARVDAGGLGTWNAFPVRVRDGAAFQRYLLLRGIDTRSDYMSILAFEEEWKRHGDVVYLPNHPGMDAGDALRVVEAVVSAVKAGFSVKAGY